MVAPFTNCLEICVSVHTNNQGFMMYTKDLSAFYSVAYKILTHQNRVRCGNSTVQQEHVCTWCSFKQKSAFPWQVL